LLPLEEFKMQIQLINKNAKIPQRSTNESAGYDLLCLDMFDLQPKTRMCVPTGLVFGIPQGYYGRIAPRSGLSFKFCIDIGGGVVDSDYRGEIKVILINNGAYTKRFEIGEAMAQIIIEKIITPELFVVNKINEMEREELLVKYKYEFDKSKDDVKENERGDQGFGSTEMRTK
jgi:dUTP pyrophosphatase